MPDTTEGAVTESEPTADPLIRALRPDVHVKGTDWTTDTVPEREAVIACGGRIVIAGDPKGHSSTDLIERSRVPPAAGRRGQG